MTDPKLLTKILTSLHSVTVSLERLGLNRCIDTEMGAIELLSKEVKEGAELISEAINSLAVAIESKK